YVLQWNPERQGIIRRICRSHYYKCVRILSKPSKMESVGAKCYSRAYKRKESFTYLECCLFDWGRTIYSANAFSRSFSWDKGEDHCDRYRCQNILSLKMAFILLIMI